ncbi:ATP-binding protein
MLFQLVNARYEGGAMTLTEPRFAEWGDVFGKNRSRYRIARPAIHYAVVIQIKGSSYRLCHHAEFMPEHVCSKALLTPPAFAPPPKPRSRPPKNGHLSLSSSSS